MITRNKRAEIDRYDVAILSALKNNTRLTTVELATIVHLSRTAVSRRIAVLKRAGILNDDAEILNYELLGFGVFAIVEINAPSHSVEALEEHLLARPEVLTSSTIAGNGLLCLKVIAVDMDHLHQFVHALRDRGDTTTKIIFAENKSQLTLIERMRMLSDRLERVS